MKAVLTTLTLAFLAACGATNDGSDAARSNLASADLEQFAPAQKPEVIVYGIDLRPVDGNLAEVKFAPLPGSPLRYEVSVRTAGYNRIEGTAYDHTKIIGDRMTCAFAQMKRAGFERLECRQDERPVDGDLKEVVVEGSKAKNFVATLHTNFYDRLNGKEVDTTEVIAGGLKRQAKRIELPRMCTMIAGVLYNPKTKACAGFTNGCEMNAMLESGFTYLPEGIDCAR